MSWDKTIKLRVKTHPFTAIYKVPLVGPLPLSLASSTTTLFIIPFTPDTLALFQAFVLAVLLATTGPLHMLFSPPRMLLSLAFP